MKQKMTKKLSHIINIFGIFWWVIGGIFLLVFDWTSGFGVGFPIPILLRIGAFILSEDLAFDHLMELSTKIRNEYYKNWEGLNT